MTHRRLYTCNVFLFFVFCFVAAGGETQKYIMNGMRFNTISKSQRKVGLKWLKCSLNFEERKKIKLMYIFTKKTVHDHLIIFLTQTASGCTNLSHRLSASRQVGMNNMKRLFQCRLSITCFTCSFANVFSSIYIYCIHTYYYILYG